MLYSLYVWIVGLIVNWLGITPYVREMNTNTVICCGIGLILMLISPIFVEK